MKLITRSFLVSKSMILNLPPVKFVAFFFNLAGSSGGGGTTDVFAYNFSALGASGTRSSSEVVVVVLSCILGFLVLFFPDYFVELIGSAISNLSVSEFRL